MKHARSYRAVHFALLLTVLPAVIHGQLTPLLTREQGAAPELGVEIFVGPGDQMYTEFDYPLWESAKLLQRAEFNSRIVFEAGITLRGHSLGEIPRCYCNSHQFDNWFGGAEDIVFCFIDEEGDGRFDRIKPPGGGISRKLTPRRGGPAPYETFKGPASIDDAKEWGGNFFKKEIVYQGVGGGVLRLLYREYVNDMAREAFSQELTFDPASPGSTIAVVKGARIEVLEAGNEGVRYRVVSGFD